MRLCGACLSGGVSVVVMRGYGNMSVREGVSDVCVNVCERGLWGISVSESVCVGMMRVCGNTPVSVVKCLWVRM